MNLNELKQRLEANFASEPQKLGAMEVGLASLREGFEVFHRLGVILNIELPGPGPDVAAKAEAAAKVAAEAKAKAEAKGEEFKGEDPGPAKRKGT